jgi:hypothetical protein
VATDPVITRVAVEQLRPQMRVGLGVDQLRSDAELVARLPNAPFEHIAHAQLAANLLCVDPLVLIAERGIARDYEHVSDARQISG